MIIYKYYCRSYEYSWSDEKTASTPAKIVGVTKENGSIIELISSYC